MSDRSFVGVLVSLGISWSPVRYLTEFPHQAQIPSSSSLLWLYLAGTSGPAEPVPGSHHLAALCTHRAVPKMWGQFLFKFLVKRCVVMHKMRVLCRISGLITSCNSQAREQGVERLLLGCGGWCLIQFLLLHFWGFLWVGVKLFPRYPWLTTLRSVLQVAVSLCETCGSVLMSRCCQRPELADVMALRCWPCCLLTCCWYLFQVLCAKQLLSCFYLRVLMLGFVKDTSASMKDWSQHKIAVWLSKRKKKFQLAGVLCFTLCSLNSSASHSCV